VVLEVVEIDWVRTTESGVGQVETFVAKKADQADPANAWTAYRALLKVFSFMTAPEESSGECSELSHEAKAPTAHSPEEDSKTGRENYRHAPVFATPVSCGQATGERPRYKVAVTGATGQAQLCTSQQDCEVTKRSTPLFRSSSSQSGTKPSSKIKYPVNQADINQRLDTEF
jgi:hypothetical protein